MSGKWNVEFESTLTVSDSFCLPLFLGISRCVFLPTGLLIPLTFGLAVRSLELELVVDDLDLEDRLEPLGVADGSRREDEGD